MNAVAERAEQEAPDLFGSTPAPADEMHQVHAAGRMTLTGSVVHAEVRLKPAGRDHGFVPVLCMQLEDVGPGRHTVYAEHAYTDATRGEADSWAKRLTRGLRVTVTTPIAGLRLSLPAADFSIDTPATPKE